jgi:hypothetical protein
MEVGGMTDVTRFWPDVPPAAFTILREIAQARQEQADIEGTAGTLPADDESLRIVASVLCEPHVERSRLVLCAALIVRCIEARDAKA